MDGSNLSASQNRRPTGGRVVDVQLVLTFLVSCLVIALIITAIVLHISHQRDEGQEVNGGPIGKSYNLNCPHCGLRTLKDQLHWAGFVATVRVRGTGGHSIKDQVTYAIQVVEIYKRQPRLSQAIGSNMLYVNKVAGHCNHALEKDKTYLISGQVINANPVVTECDLVINWSNLKRGERDELLQLMAG